MNKLCNTNVASFNRDMTTFILTNQLHDAFNISEARANKIAAAILLPHFVVSNALVKFNDGEPIKLYGENVFSPESRIVVKQMADLLGVSIQTLFIRLRQFGMIDYRPIDELLAKQILGTGDKS